MTIYTCKSEWEAMLTCIYEAWASGKGHNNIRLELEPVGQYSFFDEYIHVEADSEKAAKVVDSVNRKISPRFYGELAYTSMACEPDILDNIYRMMILGFAYGESALDRVQYKDVFRHKDIAKRVGREANHFLEFLRFHELSNVEPTAINTFTAADPLNARASIFVAHIEPKSRIVPALANHFSDRMPSEHWMIIDDVHLEAVVHPKNQSFFFRKLSQNELDELIKTENANDEFTDLWRAFFNSIAIEQRRNPKCQNNLFPIWTRKHAVEFL